MRRPASFETVLSTRARDRELRRKLTKCLLVLSATLGSLDEVRSHDLRSLLSAFLSLDARLGMRPSGRTKCRRPRPLGRASHKAWRRAYSAEASCGFKVTSPSSSVEEKVLLSNEAFRRLPAIWGRVLHRNRPTGVWILHHVPHGLWPSGAMAHLAT